MISSIFPALRTDGLKKVEIGEQLEWNFLRFKFWIANF
jgi:hypothetical protein